MNLDQCGTRTTVLANDAERTVGLQHDGVDIFDGGVSASAHGRTDLFFGYTSSTERITEISVLIEQE